MQKLNFILKENSKIIINKTINYKLINTNYTFKLYESIISFNYTNTFFNFNKKDNDTILNISYNENIAKGTIVLIPENLTFDLEMSYFNYINIHNTIIFEYIINGEEDKLKRIEINFVG